VDGEIGKIYSDALFELAKETKSVEQVYSLLNEYADIFIAEPDLTKLLAVPNITVSKKLDIVNKIFGEENLVSNLICLLTKKGRITRLESIRVSYNKKYNEMMNIAEMTVTTAVPLDKDTREKLIAKLEEKSGKKVKIREKIDKDLIGGVVVRYGNKVMDNSVRTKIKTLSDSIKSVN